MIASQRTAKVILEEIDAAREQRERLAYDAKRIYETAKSQGREHFNADETSIFSGITNQENGQVAKLDTQIQELEGELIQKREEERRVYDRHADMFAVSSTERPDRVLPTNGRMPSDGKSRYSPYTRLGKLRAFKDEQTAFDGGMCLRAIASREFNNVIDRRAEDYLESIGLEITNTSKEGTGQGGGYLVPAPLSSTIIDVKERVGISRQVCRVLPTPANSLSVPKRTGGLTVYYPDEASTITDSTKNWGSVDLHLRKRAVVTMLSQELVDDALISVADDAVIEMVYALALQEDNELINGNGASTYGTVSGLLSSIGAGGVYTAAAHTTWATLDIADIMGAVGTLPDRYFQYDPGFICSYAFFNQVLARIALSAGGVTAAEIMDGTGNVRRFAGYPVYLTSKMPIATATATNCLLFGAFSQGVLLGDNGGMRIARSNDIKFLEDQVALRATCRYDITVHDPGTASAAGAYVALSTHS